MVTEDVGLRLDGVTMDHLGSAKKVSVTKDDSVILGGSGDRIRIEERCQQIQEQLANTTSDYDKEKLQERHGKLSGGVAVIKVREGRLTQAVQCVHTALAIRRPRFPMLHANPLDGKEVPWHLGLSIGHHVPSLFFPPLRFLLSPISPLSPSPHSVSLTPMPLPSHLRSRILQPSPPVLSQVGGASEVEVGERKDRVTDALHATKAAVEEGIVPGGGTALLYASKKLAVLRDSLPNMDQKMGVDIIMRALRKPCQRIIDNAGGEGASVAGKLLDQADETLGYDAATGEYW